MSNNLHNNNAWANRDYRTIVIEGGADATNPLLISWLESNAVQQEISDPQMLDVEQLESGLTDIADSIRTTTKKSDVLAFPEGFLGKLDQLPVSYAISATITDGSAVGSGRIVEGGVAKLQIVPDAGHATPSELTFSNSNVQYSYFAPSGLVTIREQSARAVSFSGTCPAAQTATATGDTSTPLILPTPLAAYITSLEQTGVCEQNETPAPDTPADIKCNNGTIKYVLGDISVNGTPEALNLEGKNLNSGTLDHVGYSSTGSVSTSTTLAGTLCKISTKEGEQFTVSWVNITDGITSVLVSTWKTDGTWNTRQSITASGGALTYTVGANIGLINFTLYKSNGVTLSSSSRMQVERGSTATSIAAYVAPQIASVENLFAAGNYADTQDIISGIITRNVGIKVLDGTESVFASGDGWAFGISDKLKSKVEIFCTHYPYSSATMANAPDKSILTFASVNVGIKDSSFTTASEVEAFFAAQFNAGTPVIVIYPLASSKTENVSPQHLYTVKKSGENRNSITATAEVNNIPLSVTYTQAATST